MFNNLPPLSGPVDVSGEPELRRLIEKWRAGANQDAHYPHVPEVMRFLADELESTLAAAAVPSPPAQERGCPGDRCTCGHMRETHHQWGKCHGEFHVEAGSRLCKCTAFVLREVVEPPSSPVADSPTKDQR